MIRRAVAFEADDVAAGLVWMNDTDIDTILSDADLRMCDVAGRSSDDLMFLKANGQGWGKSDQARSMRKACLNANVKPAGIHTCRHTYASLAIMNGTPLMVVAQTLGHTNLAMVSAHYGHLAPSYVRDAIIKGAPRYDVAIDQKIVPLR